MSVPPDWLAARMSCLRIFTFPFLSFSFWCSISAFVYLLTFISVGFIDFFVGAVRLGNFIWVLPSCVSLETSYFFFSGILVLCHGGDLNVFRGNLEGSIPKYPYCFLFISRQDQLLDTFLLHYFCRHLSHLKLVISVSMKFRCIFFSYVSHCVLFKKSYTNGTVRNLCLRTPLRSGR